MLKPVTVPAEESFNGASNNVAVNASDNNDDGDSGDKGGGRNEEMQ